MSVAIWRPLGDFSLLVHEMVGLCCSIHGRPRMIGCPGDFVMACGVCVIRMKVRVKVSICEYSGAMQSIVAMFEGCSAGWETEFVA